MPQHLTPVTHIASNENLYNNKQTLHTQIKLKHTIQSDYTNSNINTNINLIHFDMHFLSNLFLMNKSK